MTRRKTKRPREREGKRKRRQMRKTTLKMEKQKLIRWRTPQTKQRRRDLSQSSNAFFLSGFHVVPPNLHDLLLTEEYFYQFSKYQYWFLAQIKAKHGGLAVMSSVCKTNSYF